MKTYKFNPISGTIAHNTKHPFPIPKGLELKSPNFMTLLLSSKASSWLSQNIVCFCIILEKSGNVEIFLPKMVCQRSFETDISWPGWVILPTSIEDHM